MIVLDKTSVEKLLPMDICIAGMREAMWQMGLGATVQPLRTVLAIPDQPKFMGVMPGYIPIEDLAIGAKVISVFPDNFKHGKPSHQGLVILFHAGTGEVAALVNAEAITAIRTAATTAVATDVAARQDASRLLLLGYGTQAIQHARALPLVRNFETITICGRDKKKARLCADQIATEFAGQVCVADSIETAAQSADVICALTHARLPILQGSWLRRGVHINAVGSSTRGFREIDEQVVLRSRFFGDYEAGIRAQSEEFLYALENGQVSAEHLLGDLGQVLTGQLTIRRDNDDITCFKSLGNVVQDLYASALAVERAGQQGCGMQIDC